MGHGGTLDPFATGVLPVLVGVATRLAPYMLTEATKEYRAEVCLGVLTDTLDCTGAVVARRPVPEGLDRATVEAALGGLVGTVQQRVPAYSAVRVDGERLYAKARRGEVIERPVRSVQIHEIELEALGDTTVGLRVRCGSGTYVRSLAEDLGERLGTCGHLTALRRLAVGPFRVQDAVPLADLTADSALEALIRPAQALPHLTPLVLDDEEVSRVGHGQRLGATRVPPGARTATRLRLLSPGGELVAVGEVLPDRRGVKVVRGVPSGHTGRESD